MIRLVEIDELWRHDIIIHGKKWGYIMFSNRKTQPDIYLNANGNPLDISEQDQGIRCIDRNPSGEVMW